MFKWLSSRFFWGIVLIIAGVLFLMETWLDFQFGALFWAAAFTLGGIFFLTVLAQDRQQWWSVIPAFTLLSIGAIIALDLFLPAAGEIWSGFLILGGIGASFLVVFALNRKFWWALIPAGTLITLACVALLGELLGGLETGGVFFLGLAATFAALTFVPTDEGRMRWPWIPAAILGVMGVLITAAAGNLIAWVVPLVLIFAGLVLVVRNFMLR